LFYEWDTFDNIKYTENERIPLKKVGKSGRPGNLL